jgi:hypothetical protein
MIIIAWVIYYLWTSFFPSLIWGSCDNDWNSPSEWLSPEFHAFFNQHFHAQIATAQFKTSNAKKTTLEMNSISFSSKAVVERFSQFAQKTV